MTAKPDDPVKLRLVLLASWVLSWSGLAVPAQELRPKNPPNSGTVVIPVRGELGGRELAELTGTLRSSSRSSGKRVVLDIETKPQRSVPDSELELLLVALREGSTKSVAWVRKEALGVGAVLALACDTTYFASGARIGAVLTADADGATVTRMSALMTRLTEGRKGSAALGVAVLAMTDPKLEVFDVAYADKVGIEATTIAAAPGVTDLEQRGAKIVRKRPFPDRPLVLTSAEADRLGIVKGIFGSFEDLVREEFGETPESVRAMEAGSGADAAALWLDRMKPALFVLGFLLLIIELKTPGFAVAGTLGLMLLGLAMYASWYMGLASWAEILMFFMGIGLIVVEVFLAPGTIVFAGAGLTLLVVGLVLSQQPFAIPSNDAESALLRTNLTNIVLLILMVAAGTALFWKLVPKLPWLRGAMLQPPTSQGQLQGGANPALQAAEQAWVGRVTVATSDLRPAGFVEIDGRRLDVTSEGPFVARGTKVRIIAVVPNKVIVTPVEESSEQGEVSIGFLVFLVILGTTMLIAEVFLVSFGILFVGAAVAMLAAVVLAFMHHGSAVGWTFLVADAVIGPTALLTALKVLPRTRVGKNMILSGPEPEQVKNAATDESLAALLGKRGVALTDLRPSGYARIDGRRIDVVARGVALAKDSAVLVVAVEQNRVVVALDSQLTPQTK